VVINEFMAENSHTLTNAVGMASDWIELYNTSTSSIPLQGWFLTDTAADLDKWMFPAGASIAARGYLLIYASGSNTAWVAGELHASFRLDRGGEYLALVGPDRATVMSACAPRYPEQAADISYGLRPVVTNSTLVPEGAGYRYLAPSASDSTNWYASLYDDSGWASGTGPLGYEVPTGDYNAVLQTRIGGAIPPNGVYRRQTFTAQSVESFDILTLRAKFDDGFIAYVNGVRVLTVNAPTAVNWDSTAVFDRPNADALQAESYDLSAALPLLRDGDNVLALHVLNSSGNPRIADMLLEGSLDADAYTPDGGSQWRYMNSPSPGSRNVLGDDDFLRPVAFSHDRGIYEVPFSLAMTANVGDYRIWYTVDGSVPNTNTARRYTAPIAIGTTSVVRARAVREGYEPSPVTTHTYLFMADVVRQPNMNSSVVSDPVLGPQLPASLRSLPTLSITTDSSNLFSGASGIYVNYNREGEDWERPASVEWIVPGEGDEFQVDCGIRIYGGYWRQAPKKSFRLLFKGVYGPTKLAFPVFGNDPTAAAEYDGFILRAGGNDNFLSNGLIDPFIRRSQGATGQVASRSSFVHLYLNGAYWGIYNPSERCDQSFGESYFGVPKEQWDAINAGYPTGESRTDTYQAMTYAVQSASSGNAAYQMLKGCNADGSRNPALPVHLDVDNHIDYMLTHIWAGTGDWPSHNYYGGSSRTNSTGWKYFVWDSEWSLNSVTADISGTGGPANLHGLLAMNAEYRLRFADHVKRHLFNGGALTPEQTGPRYEALVNMVEPAIPGNAARWGNSGSPGTWRNNQNFQLQTYMPQRTAVVLSQLQKRGLYPTVAAPEFSQSGGNFQDSFWLTITSSNNVYYTLDESEPRIPGSGMPAGVLYSQPIEIRASTWVKARARDGAGNWSALTEAFFTAEQAQALRVTEVMAHPAAAAAGSPYSADDFEFVELQNTGTRALDLAYVTFTKGISFAFRSQILEPGAFVLVVKNASAFAARYGALSVRVAGQYGGGLSDGGEQLELRASPAGSVIADLTYADGHGWPTAAEGGGHSLIPLDVPDQSTGILDYPGSWRASAYRGGSPGAVDPQPPRDLVINEIVAHTDYVDPLHPEYDSNDWLELYNRSGATVALTNWYLSDDLGVLDKWPIPPTAVVAVAGWTVFDEVTGFHAPTNYGFGLSKDGELAVLSYLPGTGADRVVDAVRFKAQERDVALGRYGDGEDHWFTLAPTRGSANGAPVPTVIISEIMYHPPPSSAQPLDNTADEYVELYNAGSTAAALWTVDGTWRLADGISYRFPAGSQLAPGEHAVLVAFDPADAVARAAFLQTYGITSPTFQLHGPFSGQLSNRGERLALERPQAGETPGSGMEWVVVDDVVYGDQSPWPVTPDGGGYTLQRISPALAGRDPESWSGDFTPSPGQRRAKIGIVTPQNGVAVFTPTQVPVLVSVDPEQVVGAVESVRLAVNGETFAQSEGAPYAYWLMGLTNAGVATLRAVLTDAAGEALSTPTQVRLLTVDTAGGASGLTDLSARLHGSLQGPGEADVTFFWGRTDGGTNPAAWENAGNIGQRGAGTFLADVAGLAAGQTYYYRTRGRSGDQVGWSQEPGVFATATYRDWSHRLRIGFPGYTRGTTLTNFPVLVVLSTNIAGFRYDDFEQTEASDLRFLASNGRDALPYDVEKWDPAGTSHIWVRVPELGSMADSIYMIWGNSNNVVPPAMSQQGGAWDNRYHAVWHYTDGFTDASANRVVSDQQSTSNAVGVAGSGRRCDGAGSYINPRIYKAWYGANIQNLTVSLWVRPNSDVAGGVFGVEDAILGDRLVVKTARSSWYVAVKGVNGSPFAVQPGAWQLLTLVLNAGQATAYFNDGAGQVFGGTYTAFTPAADPYIGALNGTTAPYSGLVDEVQMSESARPADWIWAHYRNVAQNPAFMSYALAPFDPLDEDHDGMADTWETHHFGGIETSEAAPDRDPDRDGFLNDAEYVAGTDPTNGTQYFRVDVYGTGATMRVQVDTIVAEGPGYENRLRWYAVETGADVAGTWAGVAGFTNILGTGSAAVIAPATGSNGATFYRGRVWLSPEE
jgi:hypothetical protein